MLMPSGSSFMKEDAIGAGALPGGEINVGFKVDYNYSVVFTENVFDPRNPCLVETLDGVRTAREEARDPARVQVFLDRGLCDATSDLPEKITAYFNAHGSRLSLAGECVVVPGGEPVKTPALIEVVQKRMLDAGLDRHSFVVIIGGGAVLDAVGYAAATFHRGLKVVRLPSTVLAQNDAGIGVKNGVNDYGVKNLIGSFSPPEAVINDIAWLSTLAERDQRAGMAEAVKVAVIRDAEFFGWLEDQADALARFELKAIRYMIYRCAELHISQIAKGGDPFERGSARPLDYGHWSAHKLESLSGNELRHGEAVAIGMALDAHYACYTGLLKEEERDRLVTLLKTLGFELWHEVMDSFDSDGQPALLKGLEEFRQHLGGSLCVTQLVGIGKSVDVNEMKPKLVLLSKECLKADAAEDCL